MEGKSPDFYPIYFRPGVIEDGSWQFQRGNGTLIINDTNGDLAQVLKYCTGHNSLEAIVQAAADQNLEADHVNRVIEDLQRLGIVVDSRELAIETHSYTDNPSPFTRPLTAQDIDKITSNDTYIPREGNRVGANTTITKIGELSLIRESCRDFSARPVELTKLMTCLANAYGESLRPVPSGGGLYPLRMYMLQKQDGPELGRGVYHYDHSGQQLVQLSDEVDETDLSFVFSSPELIHNAPSIIVIAADLKRHNSKYANRGYRYTLLEAGHSAQNIHLTAAELGLSTLEYGGFNDDDVAEVLDMAENERPLISIAVGYGNPDGMGYSMPPNLDYLRTPDGPVEWSYVDFDSPAAKLLRFYKATAKFRKPNEVYDKEENLLASGTASSPQMADVKAVAEAFERFIAGQSKFDIEESANNLEAGKWLSPEDVRPLSDEQIMTNPYVERFDPEKPIHWVLAHRANGQEIYVPMDLVYYPIDPVSIGRQLVAEADSSGMAAHTDYETAVEKALLELIERDAIMKCWLSKESPNRIDHAGLPLHHQKRAKFWEGLGKQYEVLDWSVDDVAIAGVVIYSRDGKYPFMVNGASASNVSFEKALEKASQEAELGAAESIVSEYKASKRDPADVLSPADHASFYTYSDYRTEIEWLWSGPVQPQPTNISGKKDIVNDINPVIVRLTEEQEPLQAVRVIAPELVPISFGFNRELYLHPAVKRDGYEPPKAPHFFA